MIDLMTNIDFSCFVSLKGEFEAEGLSHTDLAREALFAARNGLDYLVKIGGCEARGDVQFLVDIGIDAIVAPMIETPFAMEKYMEALPEGAFKHIGVTIETITAVDNFDAIIEAGVHLNEVTVGRTDLTASYRGGGVESERTMAMVKGVARKAKKRGLQVTIGGGTNQKLVELLLFDSELMELIDYVETRKAVMTLEKFIQIDTLKTRPGS